MIGMRVAAEQDLDVAKFEAELFDTRANYGDSFFVVAVDQDVPRGRGDEERAKLFGPDRENLRRDPLQSAQLLRGLTIAGTHPAFVDEPLTSAEIVSLALDGIRARAPEAGPC